MIDIDKLIFEALKKKVENKEAMSASAGGSFEPKLGLFSDDEKAKSEYKRTEKEEGEFKEATSSSSVGAYDAPGFEDVNMRGNNPIGGGKQLKKPLYKGGGFVTIQKKCKTFPYCTQGNSKDKPVRVKRRLSPVNEAIHNVSVKTGLSVDEIKKIILSKIDGTL